LNKITTQSGIYKIRNSITFDFYIGSASNLRQRWYNHRNALGTNRHINQHLQRAWNKYGADAFEFIIVELCAKNKLLEREQFYIDSETPAYNISKVASSPSGIAGQNRVSKELPRIKQFRGTTLLIEDFPLQIIPRLAVAIGLNEALFIQQLHYWARKSKDGWVYNTYESWQKDNFPFWSAKTIARIVYNLEDLGLIISKQPDAFDRKKYYAIDYDQVDALSDTDYDDLSDGMDQIDSMGTGQSGAIGTGQDVSFSLTETTTEITTENIKYSASSQKSDEPTIEYIILDHGAAFRKGKNTDNSGGAPDMMQDGCDNDTYLELPPEFPALSATKEPMVTPKKKLSRPRESDKLNESDHYRFYLALCEVTGNNPALQSRKVHGMAKKLAKAGYIIQDLKDFTSYWQRDWRYARDKRAPTPEELYTDIEKSSKLYRESVQEDLDEQSLKDMFIDGEIPDILR